MPRGRLGPRNAGFIPPRGYNEPRAGGVRNVCRDCLNTWEAPRKGKTCPRCGGKQIRLMGFDMYRQR